MITVVARVVLKERMKEKFIDVTRDLIEGSRAEEGNVSYDLYEDMDDGTVMTFIEVWKDEAAIESHNASDHFKTGIAAIEPLAESLNVSRFSKL